MTEAYCDHADFYTRGSFAPFVVETRSAGTSPIRIVHTSQPEGDFSDPVQPDLVLTQVLRIPAHITRDFGHGRLRSRFRHGDFEVMAIGSGSTVLAEGDNEVRAFVLPVDRVLEIAGDEAASQVRDFGPLHRAPFRDLALERLCNLLWLESAEDNPHGALFADGLLISIIAALLRLRGAVVTDGAPLSANGSAALKSWIDELIDANLDQSLTMKDLAALVGVGEMAFAQDFKAATGRTPHQYVLARRVARAQELLVAGDMPLAEIAYACGFASQSHMTDVFREKLGVTPGRYRKEVRG
ncbi:MAG: AraC family transcriptional regulator [Pseudomonadota bacterium]